MTDFFMNNKQYIVLIIAVTVFAVFGIYKAVTSSAEHNRLYRQEEEKIKRLKFLKDKFSVLTAETVASSEDSDLLEGIALRCQLMLQKKDDMDGAFSVLSLPVQYIYTLDIFVSEVGKPTDFFKNNGKPLTDLLLPALSAIGCENESRLLSPLKEMYDEDREDVSLDREKAALTDKKFEEVYDSSEVKLKAAKYIRDRAEEIINEL